MLHSMTYMAVRHIAVNAASHGVCFMCGDCAMHLFIEESSATSR